MAKKSTAKKSAAKKAGKNTARKATTRPAKKSSKVTAKKAVKKSAKKKSPKPRKQSPRKKRPFNLEDAHAFVSSLSLPKPPMQLGFDSSKPPVSLTEGIDQSLIVGSDIVSLAKELPEEQRTLVVNSLLLAQLAATDFVSKNKDLKTWYDKYFETLEKIGWLIQDFGFTKVNRKGTTVEVHEAIISVATAAFGAGATALTLVKTALDAMKKMGDGAPWMTVFKRTTENTQLSRFQVTTAEKSANGGAMISMMTFKLGTKSNVTQVLFFNIKSAKVDFQHASGKVTLEKSLAETLGPKIKQKIENQLANNIASISIAS